MKLKPGEEWFTTRKAALAAARLEQWALHDLVDPTNTATPGQVFDTVAVTANSDVFKLTADVEHSGRPRWWWVALVACNHTDHEHRPYQKLDQRIDQ